jgi:phospholipid/cholesterol/gamma-HCH transport system ATP-binding protein
LTKEQGLADDRSSDDDATQMRNVPQDTPAAGYPVVPDDQQTQAGHDQPTRVGATPPSTERPTDPGQTQQGQVPPPPPPPAGGTGDARADQAARMESTRVTNEQPAAAPSGGEDDEYRWHTDRTGRSESAASDAVEFIDVKKSFGRNTILNGLNLGIPNDQISMILGPSGTGKSVCIKHMVGLLYPDEGDVLVHGESVPNMADDELFEMRKKFGVLFQDGALFGSMNLYDNVAFPLRQHTDKGEDEIGDIVSRRLKEVGLGGAGDKMPNELSGGMRKRAGFARALVLDPQIVLFDEPDSGLDPVRTALLCELIQEIHAENGGAYVVITHDIMSARRVAEYIAILWKGRIVESGPASELFNSDNQFVRQFLSGEAQGPLGME